MKTKDAIEKFGSIREIATQLGISVQAVYKWGDDVPELREYQIKDILATRNVTGDDRSLKVAA